MQRSGPRLGIVLNDDSMIVRDVIPRSAASAAGVRPGDRLVGLNGSQLYGPGQLQSFLSSNPNSATITVRRNRQMHDIQVTF